MCVCMLCVCVCVADHHTSFINSNLILFLSLQGDLLDNDGTHKDPPPPSLGMKRSASDGTAESKRQRTQTQVADPHWALEKQHADAVINFLIRLACQVSNLPPSLLCLGFLITPLLSAGERPPACRHPSPRPWLPRGCPLQEVCLPRQDCPEARYLAQHRHQDPLVCQATGGHGEALSVSAVGSL